MVVTDLTIRKITAADHEAVGTVGFAAWAASDAFENSYLDPDVIDKVQREFAIFPRETSGDIFVAKLGQACPTSGCIPIIRAGVSAGLFRFICVR